MPIGCNASRLEQLSRDLKKVSSSGYGVNLHEYGATITFRCFNSCFLWFFGMVELCGAR